MPGVKIAFPNVYAMASDSDKFIMCDLIPGSEVAKYSPFNGRFTQSKPWPMSFSAQGCQYGFGEPDKSDGGTISILVNDFSTAKDAMSSLQNWEKMVADNMGLNVEIVDSLGDKASTSGDDEVGLNVVIGNRLLTVNLMGQFPQVTAKQKKNAAKALARLVIARLKLK